MAINWRDSGRINVGGIGAFGKALNDVTNSAFKNAQGILDSTNDLDKIAQQDRGIKLNEFYGSLDNPKIANWVDNRHDIFSRQGAEKYLGGALSNEVAAQLPQTQGKVLGNILNNELAQVKGYNDFRGVRDDLSLFENSPFYAALKGQYDTARTGRADAILGSVQNNYDAKFKGLFDEIANEEQILELTRPAFTRWDPNNADLTAVNETLASAADALGMSAQKFRNSIGEQIRKNPNINPATIAIQALLTSDANNEGLFWDSSVTPEQLDKAVGILAANSDAAEASYITGLRNLQKKKRYLTEAQSNANSRLNIEGKRTLRNFGDLNKVSDTILKETLGQYGQGGQGASNPIAPYTGLFNAQPQQNGATTNQNKNAGDLTNAATQVAGDVAATANDVYQNAPDFLTDFQQNFGLDPKTGRPSADFSGVVRSLGTNLGNFAGTVATNIDRAFADAQARNDQRQATADDKRNRQTQIDNLNSALTQYNLSNGQSLDGPQLSTLLTARRSDLETAQMPDSFMFLYDYYNQNMSPTQTGSLTDAKEENFKRLIKAANLKLPK